MSGDGLGQLRQVIVPVADVDAALPFYRDALGLGVRFQDGARWAALDAGGFTLALAGPGEQPAGDGIALGIKVSDLAIAVERLQAAGGELVDEPRDGAHERRVTARDNAGNLLVLYQPLG